MNWVTLTSHKYRMMQRPRSVDQSRGGYFPPPSPYYEQAPPGEPPTPQNTYPHPSSARYPAETSVPNQAYGHLEVQRGEAAPSYLPSPGSLVGRYPSRSGDRSAGPSQVNGYHDAAPIYIPPPQIPNRQNMSEKERIREAETRLLPSQPPVAGASGSLPTDDDLYEAEDAPRLPPQIQSPPVPVPLSGGGPSALGSIDNGGGSGLATAPGEEDIVDYGGTTPNANEDKQELERRRLQLEASAPPEVPEDAQESPQPYDAPSAPTMDAEEPDAEPTAPVFHEEADDEDQYSGYGAGAGPSRTYDHDGEQLPAYQR